MHRSILLMLAVLTAVQTQEGGPVERFHDVRAIEDVGRPASELPVDLRTGIDAIALWAFDREGEEWRIGAGFSAADLWLELLQERLGIQWGRWEVVGGRLRLEAEPEVHAELERVLGALEAHLLRRVQVDVVALEDVEIGAFGGPVLEAAGAERLIEAGKVVARSSRVVLAGRDERLDARGLDAMLHDYDVESMWGGAIGDPQVTVFREGLELGLVVDALESGRTLLRVLGRRAVCDGEHRELVLDDLGGASVELPRWDSSVIAGSAELPAGGALWIGAGGAAGGGFLIRARVLDEGAAGALPVASLVSAALRVEPLRLFGPGPSGGLEFRSALGGLEDEAWQVESAPQPLEAALRAELGLEPLDTRLMLVGGGLLVTDDELVPRVQARLAELRESAPRTVELELRFGEVERGLARRALAGELSEAALLAALDQSACGAARTGDSWLAASVRDHAYLKDYDIEISQAAYGPDPITDAVSEGTSLWCRPTPLRDGRLALWVQIEHQRLLEPIDQKRPTLALWSVAGAGPADPPAPRSLSTGVIELPKTTHAELRGLFPVEPGRWTILGSQDLPGMERALLVVVRAQLDE